jgi:hypothetical protein
MVVVPSRWFSTCGLIGMPASYLMALLPFQLYTPIIPSYTPYTGVFWPFTILYPFLEQHKFSEKKDNVQLSHLCVHFLAWWWHIDIQWILGWMTWNVLGSYLYIWSELLASASSLFILYKWPSFLYCLQKCWLGCIILNSFLPDLVLCSSICFSK